MNPRNKPVTPVPPTKNTAINRTTQAIAFLLGFYFSVKFGLGVLYLIVAGSVLIFVNLGERDKKTLSAYSVFNKNFEQIPGTFDNFVPGVKTKSGEGKMAVPAKNSGTDDADVIKSYYAKSSKMGNKECFCGSGQKFKKCCFGKTPEDD
jgi:hypothetical protein